MRLSSGCAISDCRTTANGACTTRAGSDMRASSPLAQRGMHVGAQLPDRLACAAIEGGVGVDQMAQFVAGELQLDGELEDAEEIAAARPHGRRADQHPAVRILDDLDEALVAGPVDPAA